MTHRVKTRVTPSAEEQEHHKTQSVTNAASIGGEFKACLVHKQQYAVRELTNKRYLSKMITVSAVARLMPNPPALVESRKMKCWLSGALN
jgi:hypothetical protein